jgi:hypothetical protein
MDDEKNANDLAERVSQLEHKVKTQDALITALVVMARVIAEAKSTDKDAARTIVVQALRLMGSGTSSDILSDVKSVLRKGGFREEP